MENAGIDESDPEWLGAEKTWMKIRTVNKTMNVGEWDLDLLKEITSEVKVSPQHDTEHACQSRVINPQL